MKFFDQLNSDEKHRKSLKDDTAMNTNKDKATARPWQVDKGGLFIEPCNVSILNKNIALCKPSRYSGREAMANARLIVKAVNMHDKLISTLETIKIDCKMALSGDWDKGDEGFQAIIESINDALKG